MRARGDDFGQRNLEVFAVIGCKRQEQPVEFRGGVGMKGGRCLAAGARERHSQRTAITCYRRPADKPAAFGPVHQSRERCPLDAETLGELSHSPGAGGQHAQELGLHGRQAMTV
jgi:hypothetical protein